MLELVLLSSYLVALAGADSYTCDPGDLRYLFAKVHTMDKGTDNQIKNLNTNLGETNIRIDRLNSTIGTVREELSNATKSIVHGGWSSWTEWGSCSVTCDVGMQSRERTCTNPSPAGFGNHCFGDSTDYRVCVLRGCIDGGWSSWSNWGSCSATCGFGLQKRYRTCDNPRPSPMGAFCHGSLDDVQTCNIGSCHVLALGFSVDHPHNINNDKLTFSNVIYNYGGQFDASTGIFTCATPGTYLFSVHLVKKRAWSRIDHVQCYLYKNGANIVRIFVDPTDDATDNGSAQASTTVLTSLVKGDTVYLYDCSDPSTYMEFWSVFTGVLLYSEN